MSEEKSNNRTAITIAIITGIFSLLAVVFNKCFDDSKDAKPNDSDSKEQIIINNNNNNQIVIPQSQKDNLIISKERHRIESPKGNSSDVAGEKDASSPLPLKQKDFALNFNGIDKYVEFTDYFPFNEKGDKTLEFWCLRRDNVDATIFWSSPFGGRDVNRFNIGCRDYIFYDYREDNSSIHDLGTSTEFPANKWTHHAFVRLGNVYEVYVNGILVKSTTDNNSNLPNLKGWRISGRVCRDNDMNYCSFNGQLDEVRFFNYAKRGWEIKQMMNSKLSGKEPGLIGYWDFNEGYGNTVHDKSISKMHGDFLKLEGGNSDWVISTCPVK